MMQIFLCSAIFIFHTLLASLMSIRKLLFTIVILMSPANGGTTKNLLTPGFLGDSSLRSKWQCRVFWRTRA